MEQKIKNFDRTIEKMMNETAATPPYGMWNRISNQLDAEIAPVASPASAIPKRAWIGLVAGALILGSAASAYLFFNKNTAEQTQPTVAVQQQIPTVIIRDEKISQPTIAEAKPTTAIIAKRKVVAEPVVEEVETKTVVAENCLNNLEVAVPQQIASQNISAANTPYYFPPVDIDNPEAKNISTSCTTAVTKPTDEDDEAKASEKKIFSQSSSGNPKKIKFRKRKSGGFSYGRINRYR